MYGENIRKTLLFTTYYQVECQNKYILIILITALY